MLNSSDDTQPPTTHGLPTDPIERIVAVALRAAGIAYEMPNGSTGDLDFYLPEPDVRIECKQFYSPRIAEQMSRFSDVIVIQGRAAAEQFARMVAND